MNLNISGHHLDVTPAIQEHVNQKLARVLRHFDHVIGVQVILSLEKLQRKAEVTVHVPGKDLHCEAIHQDLYAAIDLLADKLDRQILKHKARLQEHAHDALKHQVIDTAELDTVLDPSK